MGDHQAGPSLSGMATSRRASTQWKGSYSAGAGEVSLESSHLGPFEVAPALKAKGPRGSTSPMELLAAAHASCICGMVAYLLEDTGHPSDTLEAFAEVELEHRQGITGIRVSVRGVVPGLSTDEFTAIVRRAKDGCPVSKALAGTKITLVVELD